MAALPQPAPGVVIRYAYLWQREAQLGAVEGRKYRPCVVVVCVEDIDGERVVTVAPITHSPPETPADAIALTPATRRRLGLDAEQNWIVATELNRFCWPGPDLAPNAAGEYAYGELPAVVFEALRTKILALSAAAVTREG